MYGWNGTMLNIDLSSGEINKEPLSLDTASEYLGGEALATRILYDRTPPGCDPFDPQMVLILGLGPGTGTLIPGSGRLEIVTKSPLTGVTMADANVGGHFAPALKHAGYDMVIITGTSQNPVYLWIDDDTVELRDASHIWGKDIFEAVDLVKGEIGDPRVQTISIGPAAENLVKYSCVVSGKFRAAARSGIGTVMGAKKLKLVAARGTKGVSVYDVDAFKQACWDARDKIRQMFVFGDVQALGTDLFLKVFDKQGFVSAFNFSEGSWEGSKQLYAEELAKYRVRPVSCWGCQLGCGQIVEVKEGPYAGLKAEGPEFFAVMMFGSLLGISDLGFVIKANQQCLRWGLDIANPAALIAWLMEIYNLGIISRKDMDGLDLSWGNQETVLKMLEKITYREGIGDLLAEGMVPTALKIGRGSEKYVTTLLNQSPPEEFKGRYGVALCHITATRGCDHQKGLPHGEIRGGNPAAGRELFGDERTFDTTVPDKKHESVRWVENRGVIYDSTTICRFQSQRMDVKGPNLEDIARMLTALTGVQFTEESLWQLGERVYRLEMAYNAREGRRREHFEFDLGGSKWYDQSYSKGPWAGMTLDRKLVHGMVDKYLEMRGFCPQTALPTRAGLEEVGLKDVADSLEKIDLLAK